MRQRLALLFGILLLLGLGLTVYFSLPSIFGSVVAPLPEEYKPIVEKYGKETGIDPCLVAAVIRGESNWIQKARSPVGAQGLMQLMPGTAKAVANKFNIPYSPSEINNPEKNIQLGAYLLRYNFDSYGSLRNVLVAYNAGGARVKLPDKSLPRETQFYIGKITRYYDLYKSLYPDFCTGINNGARTVTTPSENFSEFSAPQPEQTADLVTDFWKLILPNQ